MPRRYQYLFYKTCVETKWTFHCGNAASIKTTCLLHKDCLAGDEYKKVVVINEHHTCTIVCLCCDLRGMKDCYTYSRTLLTNILLFCTPGTLHNAIIANSQINLCVLKIQCTKYSSCLISQFYPLSNFLFL